MSFPLKITAISLFFFGMDITAGQGPFLTFSNEPLNISHKLVLFSETNRKFNMY